MTSGNVLQNQVTRHTTPHEFVVIGTEWRKGDELEEVGLLSTRHLQLEDESRLTIARHQTPKQTRLRCNHGNKSTTQHTHYAMQHIVVTSAAQLTSFGQAWVDFDTLFERRASLKRFFVLAVVNGTTVRIEETHEVPTTTKLALLPVTLQQQA